MLLARVQVPRVISGNLAEVLAREIGVSGGDRSVDEPDLDFRATAGAFHQRCEA